MTDDIMISSLLCVSNSAVAVTFTGHKKIRGSKGERSAPVACTSADGRWKRPAPTKSTGPTRGGSRVLFVDPYFNFFNPRYKSTLNKCLRIAKEKNPAVLCEIHYKHHKDNVEPSLSSSWRDFLPSGALGGLDPDDAHHRRLTHARLNFGRSLLTDREFEILQQLLQGKSVGFIAQYLKITVSTVKVHRKHIYAKLNIKSQSELFALFLKVIAGTCDEAGVDPLDAYSRSQPISGTLTDD